MQEPTASPSADGAPPTNVRYGVLGFACSLSMITYLDRVCFGVAASAIILSLFGPEGRAENLRWAFTAFAFAYAAFEIPSGWLGDVFGPRRTLIRIVLWWSLFTAITGMIGMTVGGMVLGGITALVIVRFLFGVGEAGAYPNITRALHNWFPLRERGFAQGAVWFSGRLMGGLTPLIWVLLVELLLLRTLRLELDMSWRIAFWFFGFLGVLWCIAFAMWFRNRPDEKPEVNAAELALIRQGKANEEGGHAGVPWGAILKNGNLWLLCMMYFCCAYGWYFNITYLPLFLQEQHGVKSDSLIGALYKGGPLIIGALGCILGGILTDRFINRTGNLKTGRRLFGILGHSLCAVCYLGCLIAPSAFWFFVAISLAAFWNDITMGSAWSCCQDIGKRYAAIVAGFMNTIGNLGGAVAGFATGEILRLSVEHNTTNYALGGGGEWRTPEDVKAASLIGYEINFVIFAAVYIIAAILWTRIDPTKPVPQEPAHA